MAEFVPCVGSIQEVFRKSSTELRTVLGLSSVGTVCGASKEPLNSEMLHSAETSRTVFLKLVPQGSWGGDLEIAECRKSPSSQSYHLPITQPRTRTVQSLTVFYLWTPDKFHFWNKNITLLKKNKSFKHHHRAPCCWTGMFVKIRTRCLWFPGCSCLWGNSSYNVGMLYSNQRVIQRVHPPFICSLFTLYTSSVGLTETATK